MTLGVASRFLFGCLFSAEAIKIIKLSSVDVLSRSFPLPERPHVHVLPAQERMAGFRFS